MQICEPTALCNNKTASLKHPFKPNKTMTMNNRKKSVTTDSILFITDHLKWQV